MSIVSIDDYIVSGADDGCIYIHDHHKYIDSCDAHPNNYILQIYNNRKDRFIVSGATDGKVILWNMINNNNTVNLDKLYIYDIFDNIDGKVLNSNQHIQSLCIGEHILCGTKNGDIYNLIIPT